MYNNRQLLHCPLPKCPNWTKLDGYLQSCYKLKLTDVKHQQGSRKRNSPMITSTGAESVAKFPSNFLVSQSLPSCHGISISQGSFCPRMAPLSHHCRFSNGSCAYGGVGGCVWLHLSKPVLLHQQQAGGCHQSLEPEEMRPTTSSGAPGGGWSCLGTALSREQYSGVTHT